MHAPRKQTVATATGLIKGYGMGEGGRRRTKRNQVRNVNYYAMSTIHCNIKDGVSHGRPTLCNVFLIIGNGQNNVRYVHTGMNGQERSGSQVTLNLKHH